MRFLALFAAIALWPTPSDACVSATSWVALPTKGAPQGASHHIRWIDGRLWYLGDSITGLDPCTNTWHTLPNTGRPAGIRFDIASNPPIVGAAGKLVILEAVERDPRVFVVDDTGWRIVPTTAPLAPVMATVGTQVVIWGGLKRRSVGNGGFLDDPVGTGLRIDPVTATAKPIATAGAPSPRAGAHAISTGKQLFVWGGITKPNSGYNGCSPYGGCTLASDGALYDPATDTWTAVATANAPTKRAGASIAMIGSRVVVIGGWSDGVLHRDSTQLFDGGIYDPQRGSWEPIADAKSLFGRRIMPQLQVTPTSIVLLMVYDAARYDLATKTWSALPTRTSSSTSGARVVWDAPWPASIAPDNSGQRWPRTGDSMTMVRFDPVSGAWQTAKLPVTALHNGWDSAWAGDRLVIWNTWIEEVDPTGPNGCGGPRPPNQGCDPVVPTKRVERRRGAMIVPVFK